MMTSFFDIVVSSAGLDRTRCGEPVEWLRAPTASRAAGPAFGKAFHLRQLGHLVRCRRKVPEASGEVSHRPARIGPCCKERASPELIVLSRNTRVYRPDQPDRTIACGSRLSMNAATA